MPYNFLGISDQLKNDANGSTSLNGVGLDSQLPSLNLYLGRYVANFGVIAANGSKNTVVGIDAGIVANNSTLNTFIGANCGKALVNGQQNTFVGADAGIKNTASFNTFVGATCGTENVLGEYNTFVGYEAGRNCTGGDNSFFGVRAGLATTNGFGNNNTAVGLFAGRYHTTGSNNTVIGANNADVSHTTGGGNTLIGASLSGYGNISNTVIIADGINTKHLTMDSASARFVRAVRPPQFLVAGLPTAATVGVGGVAFATNGRKAAEGVGAGTGVPVYSDGTNWLTYYNNTTVLA
jgi:hypothetical protein